MNRENSRGYREPFVQSSLAALVFPEGQNGRLCPRAGGGRRQDVNYDTGLAAKLLMSMSLSLVPGRVTPRRAGRSHAADRS